MRAVGHSWTQFALLIVSMRGGVGNQLPPSSFLPCPCAHSGRCPGHTTSTVAPPAVRYSGCSLVEPQDFFFILVYSKLNF